MPGKSAAARGAQVVLADGGVVRDDDFGCDTGSYIGVEHADGRVGGGSPPTSWATTNAGTDAGAMPAKVSENIRPTVIAGLAKLASPAP